MAEVAAFTAPQKADSRPIRVFWWTVSRLDTARARYSLSSPMPLARAYSTTGTQAVIPWLPLPDTMTTGSSQPLIRASDPAAARARSLARSPSPSRGRLSLPIMAPYRPRRPSSAMAVFRAT
jgi:hypothetical protein